MTPSFFAVSKSFGIESILLDNFFSPSIASSIPLISNSFASLINSFNLLLQSLASNKILLRILL